MLVRLTQVFRSRPQVGERMGRSEISELFSPFAMAVVIKYSDFRTGKDHRRKLERSLNQVRSGRGLPSTREIVEALWPEFSAKQHAQELLPVLENKGHFAHATDEHRGRGQRGM